MAQEPEADREQLKHQLDIHLDFGPSTAIQGSVEIRYGYHYSGEHQLREQVLRIPSAEIAPELLADLQFTYAALSRRIPTPNAVRLPHAEVVPSIRPAGLTFIVQDQRRAAQLPIARLCYYEEIPELRSQIERRVYLERPDWTPQELEVDKRIRAAVRKIAWADYSRLVGHHLFDT